jgi:hypothetical protein
MRTNQQISTFFEWVEHTIKQHLKKKEDVKMQIQHLIPLIEAKNLLL